MSGWFRDAAAKAELGRSGTGVPGKLAKAVGGGASLKDQLHQLDVMFVMDSTGSMAGQIAEVQSRIKELSAKLAGATIRPSLAIGLVAYRDHPPEDTSYVTRSFPLSNSIDEAQRNVDSISADGGGDGPEAVFDGLNDAVEQAKWRQHSHKVIILVGDAPPHGVGAEGDGFPKGCPCGLDLPQIVKKATGRGITVFSVGVGSWDKMITSFTNLAKSTGGEFVPLANVDSLIDRVLKLLEGELSKVADDISVYDGLAGGRSIEEIARSLGKSGSDVASSIDRLKAKQVLADDAATDQLRRIAERFDAPAGPPRIRVSSPTKVTVKVEPPSSPSTTPTPTGNDEGGSIETKGIKRRVRIVG